MKNLVDFLASEDPSTGRIWVSSGKFSLIRENGNWASGTPTALDIRVNFYPIKDKNRAQALFKKANSIVDTHPEMLRPFALNNSP